MSDRWPHAFEVLTHELRSGRGRPAFVDGSAVGAGHLTDILCFMADQVVSLGDRVGRAERAPTCEELLDGIVGPVALLVEIDVLFTPDLAVEVVSQLRRTSQHTALIVVWPGQITAGRLSYSRPGRPDHVDEPARDLLVLRPASAAFPDEVPYTLERFRA